MTSGALVRRVRSEFNEMPGLQLTLLQASRLWGLEIEACRDVIDALVAADFLRWTTRGTVVRVDRPRGGPDRRHFSWGATFVSSGALL